MARKVMKNVADPGYLTIPCGYTMFSNKIVADVTQNVSKMLIVAQAAGLRV